MIITKKYGFRKPEANDYLSVEDLNFNADRAETVLEELDAEVNRINHTINLPISKTSWRGSSVPYTFTLTMAGVTSEDVPIIGLSISGEANAETVKAQNKAWSCVDRVVTSTDKITFYCYRKKPEADLTVTIKGV